MPCSSPFCSSSLLLPFLDGFRKMQSKPIRNSDFDANTAKHVTFFNENFKRGRCDLLKKIQRSTRGGGNNSGQDHQKEVNELKEKVASLETTIQDMQNQQEERIRRLELDMLGRMEQMMIAIQQQQQNQQQNGQQVPLQTQSSTAGSVMKPPTTNGTNQANNGTSNNGGMPEAFDPLPFGMAGGRGTSMGSLGGLAGLMGQHQASIGTITSGRNGLTNVGGGGPTLPPHPKMKQLPAQNLPGSLSLPPGRLDSLRGISTLSRGISNLSRGLSTESQGSAYLGNAFEDKFFSMLMNGGDAGKSGGNSGGAGNFMNPTPIQDQLNAANLSNRNGMSGTAVAQGASNGVGV